MNVTPEQLAKLPKWAQEHIHELKRDREVTLRSLHAFQDNQTKSLIWVDEHACTGEEPGTTLYRRYIQQHTITLEVGGVEVRLYHDLDNTDILKVIADGGLYFRPISSNAINIEMVKGRRF
jgi:hypothetical protein